MRWPVFMILFSSSLWAKPVVLISYFDPFGGAKANNSETVAKAVAAKLNAGDSGLIVELCQLPTVYDKGFAALEDCKKALKESPRMILSLGESTCQLKVEAMMRNKDLSFGPDNEHNNRTGTPVVPEAPAVIGLRYPLPEMYCALDARARANVDVSNNAGSFVCNNTGFLMSYHYPEIDYGFIHVPNHNCPDLGTKTAEAISDLTAMLTKVAPLLENPVPSPLPVSQDEIAKKREEYKNQDACLYEYYQRLKSSDQKTFWSSFSGN